MPQTALKTARNSKIQRKNFIFKNEFSEINTPLLEIKWRLGAYRGIYFNQSVFSEVIFLQAVNFKRFTFDF